MFFSTGSWQLNPESVASTERADPGNVGHASGVQNDPGSVVLST